MKLDVILEQWEKDSIISETDLSGESIKTPKLHHKYYSMYLNEKKLLLKYEQDYKDLYLIKIQYYSRGLSKEELEEYGWEQNPLKILKSDLGDYIDADKDLAEIKFKIDLQKEKCLFIKDIISENSKRSFNIRNSIEWNKFLAGER